MAQKKAKQEEKIYDYLTKNFALVTLILIIFILTVFYFMLIDPKLRLTIIKVQDSISFQQNVYNLERQRLFQMQENLDYFRQIKDEDVKRLEEIVPSPYPKEKLFGQIEDIVLQHGFILSELSILKETATDDEEKLFSSNLQVINLSIVISGIDYTGMKRFLPILENNLPLLDIVDLEFFPTGKSLSLKVNTYYFIP